MASILNLLICVDGTHDFFIKQMTPKIYDALFKNGHVRRIADASKFGTTNTLYVRGPTGFGIELSTIYETCLNYIIKSAARDPKILIALHFCGYSRGGAIALDLANELASTASSWDTLKLAVAYDDRVAALFMTARNALAGRSLVKTLIMFDAVDMDMDIDGAPISTAIGKVAHVRRSKLWGSRNGWGNVGTVLAKGSPPRNFLSDVNCTHAAMGGLPGTGDIPKPLARELTKLASPPMDWVEAEIMFRAGAQRPASSLPPEPGLFVNPKNGVMVDAAGKATLDRQRQFEKLAALNPQATAVVKARAFAEKQALEMNKLRSAMTLADKVFIGLVPPMGLPLRVLVASYAADSGSLRGSTHGVLNMRIGGLIGLGRFCINQKSASARIDIYRQADRHGSSESLKLVREMMGNDFPAAL